MNEKMQLFYLYFLTAMYSGTSHWRRYYEAWTRLGNRLDPEDYSKWMEEIRAFHKKYAVKKKKS